MGAKGIRRRKPYRRLPPARVPAEDEAVPPNVMWPDGASGFEASPWSPAGRLHAGWQFTRGLSRRGNRHPAVAVVKWLVLGMVAAAVLANLLAIVL